MFRLNVPDMRCGHCAGVIAKALERLDQDAVIAFDLHKQMVEVSSGESAEAVMNTLTLAGYPATLAA